MDTFRGYRITRTNCHVAGIDLTLVMPADADALIDSATTAARFVQDEYLPYWAQIWPAAVLLAEEVATWPRASAAETRVLELGCGLGLVSLVLAARGFTVRATDYDDDALAFVEENARRSRIPAPDTQRLNWRDRLAETRFPRIVAADVLYETRNLRPVAEFLHDHLLPSGIALVADFNRSTADDFPTVARHSGLEIVTKPVETTHPIEGHRIAGRIFTLCHKRGWSPLRPGE